MKLARREHPEGVLQQQNPNFGQDARTLARNLYRATTEDFPKPVDWNKIHVCTQKPDEPVHNYDPLQIVFKENSGLPLDARSTQGALNSMFTNRPIQVFPL